MPRYGVPEGRVRGRGTGVSTMGSKAQLHAGASGHRTGHAEDRTGWQHTLICAAHREVDAFGHASPRVRIPHTNMQLCPVPHYRNDCACQALAKTELDCQLHRGWRSNKQIETWPAHLARAESLTERWKNTK